MAAATVLRCSARVRASSTFSVEPSRVRASHPPWSWLNSKCSSPHPTTRRIHRSEVVPGRPSPHLAAFLGRTHHRRICLATECSLKVRQIRQRTDHAELRHWMRIALHHQALLFRTSLIAAELSPGNEKLLFRCEPVDVSRARLAFERLHIRKVRDPRSPQIADAFTEHELAVVVNVFLDEIVIKLIGDARRASLKIFQVGFGPPV